MKRFALCVIFSMLIISLSTLTEARDSGRHGGSGHGGRHQYSGRHHGGHPGYYGGHSRYHGGHPGYYGGHSRYYGGHPGYYGGYSYYYTYPFWYGNTYYAPEYYSYPQENIPSPRRCQILENGEWKDIPCR